MIFFSLISTAFSSIFYGFIVTAVIMTILYAVLRTISRGIVETPVFYATGVVLAVLLLIQSSLLIGAVQACDAADAAEIHVRQLLENMSGTVGINDSQEVMDTVIDKFPLIGLYLDIADFSGHDVSELAASMHTTMVDYLTTYVWHRVWWMLGIIVVACLIAVLFEKTVRETTETKSGVGLHSQRENLTIEEDIIKNKTFIFILWLTQHQTPIMC